MAPRLHDDEITVTDDLVHRLIESQFPQYAQMPLNRLGASGSTNVIFRLGDELLVRVPRQPGGGAAIDKEYRWLPELAGRLPVQVPEIVAVGKPDREYGERWSIVRWLVGERPLPFIAGSSAEPERSSLAEDLAQVVLALRGIELSAETADPALRWYRGRPLAEFDKWTRHSINRCRSIQELPIDLDKAEAIWTAALTMPEASRVKTDRWYHSDLVAENLLLTDGRLSAVLDFGSIGIGDSTVDLHGAWELFDKPAREVFRQTLEVSDADWLLGRAWALGIALGAIAYYGETMPGRFHDRLAMARTVIADADESEK